MLINEVSPSLSPGEHQALGLKIKNLKLLHDKVYRLENQMHFLGLFDPDFENEVEILKSAIEKKIN